MSEGNEREMTFGEKLVGLDFNPSGDGSVHFSKHKCAELIDQMDNLRSMSTSQEQKRWASIAITELQTAQMWCVKALTCKV